MAEIYDVAVIGSGPVDYAAAIRCAKKATSSGSNWAQIQAGKDKDCENRK
ncbi:MAG: hypothetical protein ACYS18_10890 [Planctomycetota bacterium]